jgi:alpha-amylase/alpha-mannosidase (GH57 family)
VSERFLCVHAHCYQPPRENPWLESIEVQDSAYPYHDWNERVTAECYAPNTAARILDGEGRIDNIINNYSKISFNFGPTLLSWMEEKSAKVYAAIQMTDRLTRAEHSGHGSALAQAYNHMIMPLANRRDKNTQVVWGIRDFEHRFGRSPEGMWLPEAAVDLETLDILVSHGIAFTILSPFSARQARAIGERDWRDVSGGRIDPSMAYRIHLPSGRDMSLFFYDGPVSRAAAFENLLGKGEDFANRLLGIFSDSRKSPQLAHIATDGETYGHHKTYGDMALAYALSYIETKGFARLTNYAEFLEWHPPTEEVEIFENSSWSCAHGVERWRSDCGCNSGMHGGWNQRWRAPVREAMDWLRDNLVPVFQQLGAGIFQDPWKARDAYIRLILDRSQKTVDKFLHDHAKSELTQEDKILALKLMELQRHAMLMYTSCGWFFDELSGIETVQALQYAGRTVQLADRLAPNGRLEREFLQKLSKAKSNLPEQGDGRKVYKEYVKPSVLGLKKVGAHYAIASVFEDFGPKSRIYCYTAEREGVRGYSSGKTKLVAGRVRITSEITGESTDVSFGVVHLGEHLLTGGVREFGGELAYEASMREITEAFEKGDFTELVRLVDKHYGSGSYTLGLLFRDEQRKIVSQILDAALKEAEMAYRQLYENRAPLMHFLADLKLPAIRIFQVAAELTLNSDLRRAIEAEHLNFHKIQSLLDEVNRVGAPLDKATLEYALRKKLEGLAEECRADPSNLALLESLEAAVGFARSTPLDVQCWSVQNIYFGILKTHYQRVRDKAAKVDADRQQWLELFGSLGEKLSFRVE